MSIQTARPRGRRVGSRLESKHGFHLFPSLPVEIQDMIWAQCITDSQDPVVCIEVLRTPPNQPNAVRQPRFPLLPPIFAVDRRSRIEVFRQANRSGHLFLVPTPKHQTRWLYFNPAYQVLEVAVQKGQTDEISGILAHLNSELIARVRYLHIYDGDDFHWCHWEEYRWWHWQRLATSGALQFRDLETVSISHRPIKLVAEFGCSWGYHKSYLRPCVEHLQPIFRREGHLFLYDHLNLYVHSKTHWCGFQTGPGVRWSLKTGLFPMLQMPVTSQLASQLAQSIPGAVAETDKLWIPLTHWAFAANSTPWFTGGATFKPTAFKVERDRNGFARFKLLAGQAQLPFKDMSLEEASLRGNCIPVDITR
ncbi:hypothetical protein K504DRAFT_465084 [Pleomassaria siparia CBS 279.74]|uniref:2EXR domain-containing protein n=1 Tax=Pleomassaria siparia CBS 279.74 TaxID=1314801 RepID=A0A6G1KEJ6_9PLEO|nr:hypothetical protein K504DRAFT_465084 [Pleomassaria siparia CBS 279.74]